MTNPSISFSNEKAKRIPSDYHNISAQHDFKWLGPEVPNNHSKTLWQCPFGHNWQASYGNIRSHQGCPVCSNHIAITSDQYRDLATERGFEWLGPFPAKTTLSTLWRCAVGHE